MEEICVKVFLTEMEAELAKNILEANNIKSVIQNEGNYGAGVPVPPCGLFVLEKDLEKAKELLGQ